MKKVNLKVVLLAVLAAGATMVTSCEKEENEVSTSNVETKIGLPEEVLPGDVPDNPDTVNVETIYWWHYKMVTDENGNHILIQECLPYPTIANPRICMIRVRAESEGATEGDVIADLDGENGLILKVRLTIPRTNAELFSLFTSYVNDGIIRFEENVIIDDPTNLLLLDDDYIEAGKYPIEFIDDKFVITINE